MEAIVYKGIEDKIKRTFEGFDNYEYKINEDNVEIIMRYEKSSHLEWFDLNIIIMMDSNEILERFGYKRKSIEHICNYEKRHNGKI